MWTGIGGILALGVADPSSKLGAAGSGAGETLKGFGLHGMSRSLDCMAFSSGVGRGGVASVLIKGGLTGVVPIGPMGMFRG